MKEEGEEETSEVYGETCTDRVFDVKRRLMETVEEEKLCSEAEAEMCCQRS